jgi:hypothetical protein
VRPGFVSALHAARGTALSGCGRGDLDHSACLARHLWSDTAVAGLLLLLLYTVDLPGAAHHHAYELAPTAAELRTWHSEVTQLAALLHA